jgi:hypothetical protein
VDHDEAETETRCGRRPGAGEDEMQVRTNVIGDEYPLSLLARPNIRWQRPRRPERGTAAGPPAPVRRRMHPERDRIDRISSSEPMAAFISHCHVLGRRITDPAAGANAASWMAQCPVADAHRRPATSASRLRGQIQLTPPARRSAGSLAAPMTAGHADEPCDVELRIPTLGHRPDHRDALARARCSPQDLSHETTGNGAGHRPSAQNDSGA